MKRSTTTTLALAGSALTMVGCSANGLEAPSPELETGAVTQAVLLASEIDTERSVMVTEQAILNRFSAQAIFSKLLSDAGDPQSPQQLVLDWLGARPDSNANTETTQAQADPSLSHYTPIALTNRFDLADPGGAHCGEYRIAFFDDFLNADGSFLIFEARLPNVNPSAGLDGCRPIAEFWANLSAESDVNLRGQALEQFYFTGVEGFPPVFHADHYRGGLLDSGQIRVNARAGTFRNWLFSEFRTEVSGNQLALVQTTTKDTPAPSLAEDPAGDPIAQMFQDAVVESIPADGGTLLRADTFSTLAANFPDAINSMSLQVVPRAVAPGFRELAWSGFRTRIQNRLDEVGSPLTVDNVLQRSQLLTCGGCHELEVDLGGGLDGVAATGQNVEFLSTESNNGSFNIKDSMQERFLPERRENLATFLGLRRECQEVSLLDAATNVFATASSFEDFDFFSSRAIDNDLNTRWSSEFSDPQWIRVDLRVRRHISRVELNWETAASAHYDIQVSNSGLDGDWHTIHTETNGNGGFDVIDNLNTIGRFVRVFSHARTTEWGVSLWEMDVLGDPDRLCTVCGNGVTEPGEECDDGNTNDQDACSNSCIGSTGPDNFVAPGRFEAEEYHRANEFSAENFGAGSSPQCDNGDGVDIQATADQGGDCNIGWTDAGETLEYDIEFPETNTWALLMRTATDVAGSSIRVEVDGNSFGSQVVPVQGWQGFGDQVFTGSISAGVHTVRVVFETGSVNLNYLTAELAQGGFPVRVQAQDYESFNDSDPGVNHGASGSPQCDNGDGVDIGSNNDNGGECSLGWTEPSEFYTYTVQNPNPANPFHNVVLRAGSGLDGRTIELLVNGVSQGVANVPNVGWANFVDVNFGANLNQSSNTLTVRFPQGAVNLNYLDIQ